jgi:hypothetical protein
MSTWPAGDELIVTGYRWIAQRHEALGAPLFATDACCKELEDAIEATYATTDPVALKKALNAFAAHMVEHFKTAVARRQEVSA